MGPLEGSMKQNDSENKINYKAYDGVVRPSRMKPREDYVGLPKDGKIDDNTESRNTYVKYDGVQKPGKYHARPDIVGLPDGVIQDDTETRNTYKGHIHSSMPIRQKRTDDNLVLLTSEKMENDTLNKGTYTHHPVTKTQRIRQGNNNILLPKENLDSNTVNRNIYKHHEVGRPNIAKRKDDNFEKFGEEFQADSESKGSFKGYNDLTKPGRHKKSDHLGPLDGVIEDRTEARESYRPNEVAPIQRVRAANDTIEIDGKVEGTSETQEKYSAKFGRRSERMKPLENLTVERSKSMSSLNSITSHDYRGGFESKRPEKVP